MWQQGPDGRVSHPFEPLILAATRSEGTSTSERQAAHPGLGALHRHNGEHHLVQRDRGRLDDQPAEPSRRSSWPAAAIAAPTRRVSRVRSPSHRGRRRA